MKAGRLSRNGVKGKPPPGSGLNFDRSTALPPPFASATTASPFRCLQPLTTGSRAVVLPLQEPQPPKSNGDPCSGPAPNVSREDRRARAPAATPRGRVQQQARKARGGCRSGGAVASPLDGRAWTSPEFTSGPTQRFFRFSWVHGPTHLREACNARAEAQPSGWPLMSGWLPRPRGVGGGPGRCLRRPTSAATAVQVQEPSSVDRSVIVVLRRFCNLLCTPVN